MGGRPGGSGLVCLEETGKGATGLVARSRGQGLVADAWYVLGGGLRREGKRWTKEKERKKKKLRKRKWLDEVEVNKTSVGEGEDGRMERKRRMDLVQRRTRLEVERETRR